ncbi:S-layer homology domain-containing protein [Bacillus sp. REN10]|uniref:S-layer homology domain-containing protein n=1 Tax=Bacillus sp. REN10 TaxID=2782541 RepID=UPI00193B363C|nr:S-layer homology domain-containing protein [Bacillus sp. REN10]
MNNKSVYMLALAACLSVSTFASEIAAEGTVESEQTPVLDAQKNPPLLITELVPNTTNIPGTSSDAYEFIEIYNNSDQSVSLKDYQLIYRYPDGSKPDAAWIFKEDKTIPAQGTIVVWVKNDENTELTLADFNKQFNRQLTEDQLTTVESAGMANGAARTLVIADTYNNELSEASYSKEHVQENNGIQYQLSADQKKMAIINHDQLATPGEVSAEQVPQEPVHTVKDTKAPVIEHTSVTSIQAGEDIQLNAQVTDDLTVKNVKVTYRLNQDSPWKEVNMSTDTQSPNTYKATIPKEEIIGQEIFYQIHAFDGMNIAKTAEFKVAVEELAYDSQQVPELLVTEIVPDSANVGGLDGYELIEVYNNTTETVNLKDYKIRYRYPAEGPGADLIWGPEKEDLLLPSGETMVFWIINGANQAKTVADFNQHYGVDLIENENIVKVFSGGMANSGARGIAVATNTGKDVSVAYYNDEGTKDDTVADKGIFYTFPKTPGDTVMKKYSSGTEAATPGTVAGNQAPSQKVKLPIDNETPAVSDITDPAPVSEMNDIQLTFDVKDNRAVKTARLFYKTNKDSNYQSVDLTENYDDKLYHHTIYSPSLIGKQSVEYYLVVSDGVNELKTEPKKISILQDQQQTGIGLNVENDSLLNKTALIKASHPTEFTKTKLFVDGKDVTSETTTALAEPAYFAFDVKKVNLYFKNGVTIGDEALHIFDDTIDTYVTKTVPIDPKYFEQGKDAVISIRSGTKVSPFDQESEENRDDFYVKNVRLVLRDGTVIYDPAYNNPEKEISVGDGASAKPVIDFSFKVPDEKFIAKAYKWDTTKVKDGAHIVEATNGTEKSKVNVLVDNLAPVLTSTVEEGKEYKGSFTINVEAKDELSGVNKITAELDGKEIALPFETSSAKLEAGKHTLKMTAVDQIGNETTQAVTFHVAEERPYKPEAVNPKDGATNVSTSTKLKVKVSDPTKDDLDVAFMKGYKYKANETDHVSVYENNVDREPPKEMIPSGETAVSEVDKLAAADQQYVTTKSTDQFPYQRFEVKVDEEMSENDEIELNWEGKSLIGRKVSMYVWNYKVNKWELMEWKVAENDQNFKLTGTVKGADYVKDKKVQVMVQDEIASTTQFDYSFIWMSDTQYYSESYPHIFKKMTEWTVAQKEAMNIKYAFHTGDLVDEADQEYQWKNADESMRYLDTGNVPYGVLAGNHDVGHKTGDYNEYGKYFGEARFKDKDYYGESYKNNRGHYDLISSNGNDFIMLYMGWGVNDEDIAWMNKVLAKYPERKAILNFHEYLLVSGNRSPIGDKVYNEVVLPNKNIIAVLSGHYHDSETLVDEIDDNKDGKPDRKVYQMLADYQGGPEGGQGFLRIMQVNPVENKIYMKTYSPYLDKFNYYDTNEYPGKDEFVIDTDLTPKEKVVATDFFEANVFTDQKIGEQTGVKDQQTPEVSWNNLEANKKHGWYVTVKDQFEGEVRSDVWTFSTKTKETGGGNPGNGGGTAEPPAKPEVPNGEEKVIEITEEQIQTGANEFLLDMTAEKAERMGLALSKELVAKLATSQQPLKIVLDGEHEVTLSPENLAYLQQKTGEMIHIKVSKKAQAVKAAATPQFKSDLMEVTVLAGEQTVLADLPVPLLLKMKLSGSVDKDKTTGASYHEKTQKWEYAGGYLQEKHWVIPVRQASMLTVLSNDKVFKDTNRHWAKKEIHSLASKLITSGKTDDLFAPEQKLTRAEFAVLLVRAMQVPVKEYEGIFTDVPESKTWAAAQIEAANRAGIVLGKEDGAFDPDANITREQMAVMITRAIEYQQADLLDSLKLNQSFKDDKRIGDYAKVSVKQAVELGIINGYKNGKFEPKRETTRAETAVMLYRMLNRLNENQ